MAKNKWRKMRRKHKETSIPAYLLYDSTITLTEAFILAEIDALDGENGCYAMDLHFATLLRVTPDRAGKIISGLDKKGWLIRITLPTRRGKKRFLTVNWPDRSHTVKTPDGHTVNPPYPYGENTVTHTVKTPDGNIDEENKEVNSEGRENTPLPPPHLSEAEEIEKLTRTAGSGSLTKEESARYSYLNSKVSSPTLSQEFFTFFEAEVLKRFNKLGVTDVILGDWAVRLFAVYGWDVSAEAVSKHFATTSGWTPRLATVIKLAKEIKIERNRQKIASKAALNAKKQQENTPKEPAKGENNVDAMEKYRVVDKTVDQLEEMKVDFFGNDFMILRIQKQITKLKGSAAQAEHEEKKA